MFSQLLRLLATHFPHLSLVDDWMNEEGMSAKHDEEIQSQKEEHSGNTNNVGTIAGLTEAEINDGKIEFFPFRMVIYIILET